MVRTYYLHEFTEGDRRMNSFNRLRRVIALGLCTIVPMTSLAIGQTLELLTAVPSNHLVDPSPTQSKAIERLQKRPTTEKLTLVTVNIDALKGDTARLNVPSIATLSLSKRSEDVRSPSDFTWYGTLSEALGQATLVVHNGNVTGSIQGQDSLYRIEPIGNGIHALIKVDTRQLPQDHPPPPKGG
jgi:hypothetical protein